MIKKAELKKHLLFEDIGDKDLEKMAGSLKLLSLKKGESLFQEGDVTKGIYLVRTGKVAITKLTADGWQQTLALLPEGSFFGELSILENRKHEASAAAVEKTELIVLGKEEFEMMEKEESSIAFQIIKKLALVMSKNLRRMNEKFLNALINY